jgi:hypothetical protein
VFVIGSFMGSPVRQPPGSSHSQLRRAAFSLVLAAILLENGQTFL